MSFLAPLEDWLDAPTSTLRQHAFDAAQFAAEAISGSGIKADGARDVVIRLLAILEARADELADFRSLVESLTREIGLFPYLEYADSSLADAVVQEAFRSTFDPSMIFHVEQQRIFKSLSEGKNVVASAPTSFGKSLLIDSIIASDVVQRSAIIVPTLALLDETRRRLSDKFSDRVTLVFHRSQAAPDNGKVVFIGTQERLLDRTDIRNLDLLVVDEFYKADPQRADARFVALNAAISKLSRLTKQFFLIGPFIDGIDARGWRYADVEFIKTSYRTVAVDPVDLRSASNDITKLAELLSDPANQPALVFVKSPKSATDLAAALVDSGLELDAPWAREFSGWLGRHYTPHWSLVEALRAGVGYHHGRMPRSIASALVRGFNRGKFDVLLCTSTLIEGVNTAAKSVFIWDKKIDGKDIDFFTLSNIRGRAGRMGHHFVGKVYYFHAEPPEELHEVEVPGLGDGANIDEILVHYDDEEVPEEVRHRIVDWSERTGLTISELQRFGTLGFERLAGLKDIVDALDDEQLLLLSWDRFPKWGNLEALLKLVWAAFDLRRSGAKTLRQLTWLTMQLMKRHTLSQFFKDVFFGDRPSDPDDIFAFLRTCEFSLPEMIMATQAVLHRNRTILLDYSLFTAKLENWFKAEALKSVEEVGLPIVLLEQWGITADASTSVDDVVRMARRMADRRGAGGLELEMVEQAAT